MEDIKGVEIEIGDVVKTQQPGGGILPPAPAQDGTVVEYEEVRHRQPNRNVLAIKYRREGQDFDRFILLEGKINEVIKKHGS